MIRQIRTLRQIPAGCSCQDRFPAAQGCCQRPAGVKTILRISTMARLVGINRIIRFIIFLLFCDGCTPYRFLAHACLRAGSRRSGDFHWPVRVYNCITLYCHFGQAERDAESKVSHGPRIKCGVTLPAEAATGLFLSPPLSL